MQSSSLFKLNVWDLVKGLLVAVLTTVLVIAKDTLSAGSLNFDWSAITQAGLLSAVAYLLKNLFTNQNGELFKK